MSSEEIFTLRKIGDVWIEVIPSCFNLSLYQHRHPDYVIRQLIDDKQLLDKELSTIYVTPFQIVTFIWDSEPEN